MNSLKRVLGCIRKADQMFSLFKNGDKVVLGISGGKDSMAMLYSLSLYQKFRVEKFELYPVILNLGFNNFDASVLEEYCKKLGLTLTIVNETQVYEILKLHLKDNKLPCSICSKMKKAAINKAANDLGCNKVAFAHHADDAIETLFMNEIYGGKIATFEPKMKLERANMTFIRPMILVREDDIKTLVRELDIPILKSHCPNDGFTMREEIKNILKDIYTKYPSSKANFLSMIYRHDLEGTWKDNLEINIEGSKFSLREVILKEDLFEEMLLNVNLKTYDASFDHYLVKDKENRVIGRICARINNNKVYLKDIFFKKNSKLRFKKVLGYFERKYLMNANPIYITVLDKLDSSLMKELGYKKTKQGYQKIEYVK